MALTTQHRSRPSRHGGAWMVFGVLLLLLVAMVGAGTVLLPPPGIIARGVQVTGIPLGGLTRQQARETLEHVLGPLIDKQVTLAAGSEQKSLSLPQLGVHLDPEATLRDALAVGHRGALPRRIWSLALARWCGASLPVRPAFTMDDAQAHAVVQSLATSFNRPPVDASAAWRDGRVVVTPGHGEEALDTSSSVTLITQSVLGALNARQDPPTEITLPSQETQPHITTAMLQAVDTILGSYSTSYASSSANRANNVVEAAKTLNHMIVMPGETFSFNRAVGPRSEDTGFLEAPVIVKGKMVTGIGGGICQVSTTLYNAVLLSNLKIVTRNHHSLPSHYVPTGLDATVSYGSLDFCFRNETTAPVVIESQQGGGRLLMRILGKGPAPRVKIERSGIKVAPSPTVTQTDPTLPEGMRVVQKGRPTKEVTVYRVVDGEREFLSHDRYEGDPTIIRIGSGPAKTPAVTPPGAPSAPMANPHVTHLSASRDSSKQKSRLTSKSKPRASARVKHPTLVPSDE